MAQQSNKNADGDPLVGQDLEAVKKLRDTYKTLRAEVEKIIVGQDQVLDQLLIALFAGGHCILEGVPGLAKTLMISTLSKCLNLTFNRIQFTPDLMPSDITGTEVIQEDKATGTRNFKFLPGPIFANVILADEINRTPPKTQAALLEAMQERQVTVGGDRHQLLPPFFVLATQNPIEQEGTYPLPEAQQDRFMFKVFVGYPSYDEEYQIAEQTTVEVAETVRAVLGAEEIVSMQRLVRRVPAAPSVIKHALDLIRRTRPDEDEAPGFVRKKILWGAGPRAVQCLVLGAKARAVLQGREYASTNDVRAIAHPVLRHRVIPNFSVEAEGDTVDKIVDELLAATPANASSVSDDEQIKKILST